MKGSYLGIILRVAKFSRQRLSEMSVLKIITSGSLYWTISDFQNVRLFKCQTFKMSEFKNASFRNVRTSKCDFRNFRLSKCKILKISVFQYVRSQLCQVSDNLMISRRTNAIWKCVGQIVILTIHWLSYRVK